MPPDPPRCCGEGGAGCAPDYTCIENTCERCLHCRQWLQDQSLEGERPWCPDSEELAAGFHACACDTCNEVCGSSGFCSGGGDPASPECEQCMGGCSGAVMECYLDTDVSP